VSHGGARAGAGRKKGSTTVKTREVADRAAAEGITPLEVMLKAMRTHYDKGEYDDAAGFAKDAAPYMHPRLAAVALSGNVGMVVEVAELVVRTREEAKAALAAMAEAAGLPRPEGAG
jgi:hypothetical protein